MRWKTSLILYTLVLLVIFISAYLKLIPTEIKAVPFYDSIGHFVLYGIWGYLFARVFNKNALRSDSWFLPWGILLALTIAIVEESLQSFSAVRTFSLFDLGWGIVGILLALFVVNQGVKNN